MFRKKLAERGIGLSDLHKFRHRGKDVSRIEGFSDAVFAFAVTLLVVSLQVPQTFDDLMSTMKGFAAFALSFAMLVLLWYEHYLFFRRYALQDTWTIVVNSALLFVILIYIYPLKFLSTLLVSQFTDGHAVLVARPGVAGPEPQHMITVAQLPTLMAVYGFGFVAVYVLFALLHAHAARSKELDLTRIEMFDARAKVVENFGTAAVGMTSVLLALLVKSGYAALLAGFAYWLIPVQHTVHGVIEHRRRRRIEKEIEAHMAAHLEHGAPRAPIEGGTTEPVNQS